MRFSFLPFALAVVTLGCTESQPGAEPSEPDKIGAGGAGEPSEPSPEKPAPDLGIGGEPYVGETSQCIITARDADDSTELGTWEASYIDDVIHTMTVTTSYKGYNSEVVIKEWTIDYENGVPLKVCSSGLCDTIEVAPEMNLGDWWDVEFPAGEELILESSRVYPSEGDEIDYVTSQYRYVDGNLWEIQTKYWSTSSDPTSARYLFDGQGTLIRRHHLDYDEATYTTYWPDGRRRSGGNPPYGESYSCNSSGWVDEIEGGSLTFSATFEFVDGQPVSAVAAVTDYDENYEHFSDVIDFEWEYYPDTLEAMVTSKARESGRESNQFFKLSPPPSASFDSSGNLLTLSESENRNIFGSAVVFERSSDCPDGFNPMIEEIPAAGPYVRKGRNGCLSIYHLNH